MKSELKIFWHRLKLCSILAPLAIGAIILFYNLLIGIHTAVTLQEILLAIANTYVFAYAGLLAWFLGVFLLDFIATKIKHLLLLPRRN